MMKLRFSLLTGAASALLTLATGAVTQAQQNYVGFYDAYVGFADINAPALGLNQPGFHTQLGVNPRPWYSVGFDFSIASGSELLTPSLLPANLQALVAGAQQQYTALGLLPPGYKLVVPTDVDTQTYAFGPQYINRHFKRITFFARPSLGALHEHATPRAATDPFQGAIIAQLVPHGSKSDWTGFYGVGGGGDFAINKHFGLRTQLDIVYNHPFNDILASGRTTYRVSIGPSFHFGKNEAVIHDRGHHS